MMHFLFRTAEVFFRTKEEIGMFLIADEILTAGGKLKSHKQQTGK